MRWAGAGVDTLRISWGQRGYERLFVRGSVGVLEASGCGAFLCGVVALLVPARAPRGLTVTVVLRELWFIFSRNPKNVP